VVDVAKVASKGCCMELKNLVYVAVLFVIAGFVLAIGQMILVSNTQSTCNSQALGTWGDFVGANTTGERARSVNPIDGSFSGCCTNNTAYNRSVCYGWQTASYAINSSYFGLTANNTLAYWLPTTALAVAAGFVISMLILYLLGSLGSRSGSSTV
jgi:hypothetical protein